MLADAVSMTLAAKRASSKHLEAKPSQCRGLPSCCPMSDQDRLTHDTEVKQSAVASSWDTLGRAINPLCSPIGAPASTRVAHPNVATAGNPPRPIATCSEVTAYRV